MCSIKMILGYQPHEGCEMVPWTRDTFIHKEHRGVTFSLGQPVNMTYRCYTQNGRLAWGQMLISGWGMIEIPRKCKAQLETPALVLRGLAENDLLSVTNGREDPVWTQKVQARVRKDRSLTPEARTEMTRDLKKEAEKRHQVQQQVKQLEMDVGHIQQLITENKEVIKELQEIMVNETISEEHVEQLIQEELPSEAWEAMLTILYIVLMIAVILLGHKIKEAQGTIKEQINQEEEELGYTTRRSQETPENQTETQKDNHVETMRHVTEPRRPISGPFLVTAPVGMRPQGRESRWQGPILRELQIVIEKMKRELAFERTRRLGAK